MFVSTLGRLIVGLVGAVVAAGVWHGAGDGGLEPLAVVIEAEPLQLAEGRLWMAPSPDPVPGSNLELGVRLLSDGRAQDALQFFQRETSHPALGAYATLYAGRSQLNLGRHDEAMAAARYVINSAPGGALGESALWLLAESLERKAAWGEAVPIWQTLTGLSSPGVPAAYLRLAVAAEKVDDASLARGAYVKIHYEFPTSPEAEAAGRALSRPGLALAGPALSRLESGRAEKLFAARRFADARKAYETLLKTAPAEEQPLVALRLALTDFHLNRYAAARDGLRAILDRSGGAHPEAEFYWLGTLRGLNRRAEYLVAVPRFVSAYPTSPLAESALNDLATYHVLADDDAGAARVFTEMYARFPNGAFADRAAWRAGWWAYKQRNYRETIRLFESASVAMRRADYRPSWLYWAARAHEELGDREAASHGYRQTIRYYRNSYYGREASRALARVQGRKPESAPVPSGLDSTFVLDPGVAPATAPLVQALLGARLYDDALAELRKAQFDAGTSPIIEATIAYALNRKGELRPGITAMRRAYPQFMAEGGEGLPRRILNVIFPVAHWDLLRRYADQREIDTFLLTALVAQESTFQADVRSSADAWGLMQLLPSTGRRYATKVGVRGFSTSRLTDPETNVRLGTAYLSDLLKMFGDAAPALAAYNAGENRVARWRAERPGVPRDEFVDDIPFPETQNYVKRIIGTAEDYRLLYGQLPGAAMRDAVR